MKEPFDVDRRRDLLEETMLANGEKTCFPAFFGKANGVKLWFRNDFGRAIALPQRQVFSCAEAVTLQPSSGESLGKYRIKVRQLDPPLIYNGATDNPHRRELTSEMDS